MQEFIKLAQDKLGLSAGDSESSTATLVGLLKDKLPSGDFGDLAAKIPGLEGLAGKASGGGGGGGLLGGLASSAASLLGGKGAGDSVGLLQKLAGSGLSLDKAGSFVGLFTEFIKNKAGGGMLDKVLAGVPDLKKLISG